MKKRITSLLLLILFSLFIVSCKNTKTILGEGEYISKEQELKNDTSLVIDNIFVVAEEGNIIPIEVNIKDGETKKLVIESRESILDYINIDETLGILTISANPDYKFLTEKIVINIFGLTFSSIITNLSVVKCETFSQNLTINLKKASKFVAEDIDLKSLSVSLDYSCSFDCANLKSNDLTLALAKKSIVNISNLQAQNANIQTSNAECNIESSSIVNSRYNITDNSKVIIKGVSKTIDISITGASYYYGENNVSDSATLIAAGNAYVEVCANSTINVIDCFDIFLMSSLNF